VKKTVGTEPEFARIYGIPTNVEREKVMTGQVMFRKSSQITPPGDDTDREMMIVVGIVAVPKGTNIDDHTQYPILGEFDQTMFDDLKLQVGLAEGETPKIELNGLGVAGLLKSAIWKV